jgi:hypothetical protein
VVHIFCARLEVVHYVNPHRPKTYSFDQIHPTSCHTVFLSKLIKQLLLKFCSYLWRALYSVGNIIWEIVPWCSTSIWKRFLHESVLGFSNKVYSYYFLTDTYHLIKQIVKILVMNSGSWPCKALNVIIISLFLRVVSIGSHAV